MILNLFNFFFSIRDALIPFATDSSMGSYVGMTTTGDNGGIGYQPGVCGNLAQRTSVVQDGKSDMETAEVMHLTVHLPKVTHPNLTSLSSQGLWELAGSNNSCCPEWKV